MTSGPRISCILFAEAWTTTSSLSRILRSEWLVASARYRVGSKNTSTAADTAPQPLWPSTTMVFMLPPRCSTAYLKLPSTSLPRPLPATRITKRSLGPSLKISSIGTRASEHPRTAAKGLCFGLSRSRAANPSSCRSISTMRLTTSSPCSKPSSKAAKARFPSSKRRRAASESVGRGRAGTSCAQYR